MAISTQDIYEAYRKLKTFVYYNGQPLSLRRKLAEFELEMLEEDSEDSKISEDTPLSNPSEDLGVDIGNNLRDIFKESFKEKFSKRIEPLERILNGPTTSEAKNKIDFDHWLDEIRYTIVPKELREASPIDEHFITNEIAVEDYVVEKCNFIIDAPIEIYLIATLWTIKLGRRLNRLISRDNYAYRLSIFDSDWYPEAENEEEVSSGQLLYDPYFIGYREWRDRALNKVSDTLDNGENAVILSLDIKRYFYNVRLNVYDIVKTYLVDQQNSKPVIPQGIDPDETRLCLLLQKVHEKYATLFPEEQKMDGGKVLLPIGLPSSGLLGNLALKPLDDYIRNYVTPAYYGRYVDDILLVFSGKGLKITRHPESESNIDGFITDHLVCEQPVNFPIGTSVSFSRQVGEDRKSEISYCVKTGSSELYVKLEKVIMEFFNCNESRAAINKFKKQLEKNRSEFRYLPWEEEINLEFDDEAFRLEISDSVNKIRNIEGISEDKYGASKYLAKKIFLSTLPFDSVSKEESEASAKQILTYFKGRTPILMNSLWEKVATYFVINGQSRNLDKFRRQVLIAIGKVKAPNEENQDPGLPKFKEQEVRAALAEHLNISIALAVAVHPSILDVNSIDNEIDSKINKMADGFRQTYLFRHQYQYLKGYCYTLQMKGEEPLVSKNLISSKVNEIQPSYAPYVTPVFLKPHEISLLHIYHKLSTSNNPRENPLQDIIDADDLKNTFRWFNYEWRQLFLEESEDGHNVGSKYFEHYLDVTDVKEHEPAVRIIGIRDGQVESEYLPDKKIGIVNWKIDPDDLDKSILGKPNKSSKRREKLFEVLNYSAGKHVEMLVFPETSIPVEWLPLLVDHAVRNDCAIIGGLEFYVTPSLGAVKSKNFLTGMYVYNLSFSIFPVRMKFFDTAALILRKKNYYAPAEQKLISSYHKLEPDEPPMYHLIHWRKTYFSNYNCFELSNLSDRAIFKSKVDFLIAIEYNSDIHYFSNITEAWTRDLHCYIIQTNSSDYGDTKVVQPTKSVHMDVMKIKGGDFPIVMITTLKIDALRRFHRKGMIGQIDNKTSQYFKPTPACYEWQWAERRILDQPPSDYWFK